MLTFVCDAPSRKNGNTTSKYALYRCECGTEKEILVRSVQNKQTISCGCVRKGNLPNGQPLIGRRFGKLVILSKDKTKTKRNPVVNVQCDCGNTRQFRMDLIYDGKTHCGCENIIRTCTSEEKEAIVKFVDSNYTLSIIDSCKMLVDKYGSTAEKIYGVYTRETNKRFKLLKLQ